MIGVYQKHSVDTPYIKKNYKDILRKLYDEGTIQAVSPNGKPPKKDTFGDEVKITFPN
jgi:hypothetical protein